MSGYTAFARVVAGLVGVAVVSPLTDYFISKRFNIFLAACIASVISAVLIVVLEYLLVDFPYHFLWFRKKTLSISNMEGTWIEIQEQGERVVCIATIEFDYERKKHVYKGRAYSKDGVIKATWESKHLSGEPNKVAFTFIGIGEVISPHQFVRNVGQIEFWSTDPGNKYKLTSGHGTFYDYDSTSTVETQNNFLIDKLSTRMCKHYIGKKAIKTLDDERNFVVKYYEDNADRIP